MRTDYRKSLDSKLMNGWRPPLFYSDMFPKLDKPDSPLWFAGFPFVVHTECDCDYEIRLSQKICLIQTAEDTLLNGRCFQTLGVTSLETVQISTVSRKHLKILFINLPNCILKNNQKLNTDFQSCDDKEQKMTHGECTAFVL